jgi:hypothetical protein
MTTRAGIDCRRWLAAATLALTPVCAAAQTSEREAAPIRGALTELRAGTFSLAPTFELVNVGIDTNIFNDDGPPVSDVTMTLQPGVDVGIRSRGFTLVTRAAAGYAMYARHPEERALNPRGDVTVERRLGSRFAISADGAMASSKARGGFEVESRPRTSMWSGGVRARVSGRRLRFDGHAGATDIRYDREALFRGVQLSRTLDRWTRSAGAGAEYRLSPYTGLTLTSDVVADRFPNAAERNTDSAHIMAGVNLDPRAVLAGSAALGYRLMKPLREARFDALIAEGGLSFTWRDRLGVSGGAKRNLDYSYRPDQFVFSYDLYELAARQAIWRGLDLGARTSWTQVTYRRSGIPALASAQPGNREYLTEMGVSTGVRLRRGRRVGVYVSQWERRAGEHSYKTLRSGFEVTFGKAVVNERGVYMYGPGR